MVSTIAWRLTQCTNGGWASEDEMTTADRTTRQRRHGRRRHTAVAVVVALFVAACGSSGDEQADTVEESAAPTTTATTATTTAQPTSTVAEVTADPPVFGDMLASAETGTIYPGYNLTVTADMIDMSVAPAPPLDGYDGLQAVADGVDVQVTGDISAPLLVQLSMPPPPNDTAIPAVLHIDGDGNHRVEAGMWDAESNTITVWAHSFSDRYGGWWNPANWVEEVIQVGQGGFDWVADWVTGRTDPPACDPNPPTWASVATVDADSLHTCLQTNPADDGAERVELYLKSNRATMQLVSYPGSVDFLWVDNQSDVMRRLLTTAVTGEPDADQILLLGGQAMSYGLRRPAVPNEFISRTTQTRTVVIANQLLGILGGVQGDAATAVALAISACVLDVAGVDVLKADVVPDGHDSMAEFGGAMVRCGIELLSEPDALVAVADEALLTSGADVIARNDIIGRLRGATDKLAPAATRLLAAVNVGGALVRAFDGLLDNQAEGSIVVTLDPPAPPAAAAPPPQSTIPDEILSAASALARVEVPSLCLHPAGVAVDGTIPSNDPLGTDGYWGMNLDGAVAGQLDDDPALEYAVTVDCSAGGVSWPSYVLLYDDDVSLVGHFNLGDLFPDDGVWRGGIGGLAFDPWLSGDVEFEESGTGPWWESYFVLESFDDYPCVTVGDLVTFDPYGIDVGSGEICSQGGQDMVTSAPDPVNILTDYLLAAGARDYSAAWSMLTAGYQNKYGSYDKFTLFWNGIDVVGINSATVVTNGSTATITADVWFKRTDGTTSSEIVEVDITGDQVSDYRFIRAY